jgi:glycosyltransferase involved in cell wall biosynthesis
MYKIVQIIPALGWGGAQVFCVELCNELAKNHCYNVTLVSLYNHDPINHLPLSLLDERVKFVALGKRKGFDFNMFFRVRRLLNALQPDIVHTHLHASYYCFLSYVSGGRKAFKKIHTFHSEVKTDSPWRGRQAYKYFFKKGIIHPVSISEEVHKSALNEYGNVVKTLIKNGCTPVNRSENFERVREWINSVKFNNETKVLLNVARISKLKNQQLLIDCMKTLEAEGENVIALVLGDFAANEKPLYNHLMKMKSKNVYFLGKVKNVGDYYLNSDAFVLTSKHEGLPISLLEALSAGLIPVCTPAGGVADVVKKNVGFLSKDCTYKSYLNTLRSFLNTDKACRTSMQEKCIDLFQNEFCMGKCAALYQELYHS